LENNKLRNSWMQVCIGVFGERREGEEIGFE